jgi:hypothetical protein
MLQRVKYLIFQFSTTSRISAYIFLISLALIVVTVGMGAFYFGLFSSDSLRAEGIDDLFGGGFADTFWWSMKHVFDPGAISENYGAPPLVIIFAIFTSLSGLVITGALIGFIVTSIQNAMEEAKNGSFAIKESNHLLILGWNKKSTAILKQFVKHSERLRVVVLTSVDIGYVRRELKREAGNLKKLRILPMQGSIALASELERAAVSKASYILVLTDGVEQKSSANDVATIKTLMLLNTVKKQSYSTNIVAEIEKVENLPIASVASKLNHPIVSTADFIGKTLVQCARYPGYASVYEKLFSGDGHSLEILKLPIIDGMLFGELARRLEGGILIGVSWEEEKNGVLRRAAVLNPDADYDLMQDDELIVIRSVDKKIEIIDDASNLLEKDARVYSSRPKIKRALIISKSSNLRSIIQELDQHSNERVEIVLACKGSKEVINNIRENNQELFSKRLVLESIEFDLEGIWSLEFLKPDTFDAIFVVADESDNQVEADNETALILLLLREMKQRGGGSIFPPVVAEFLSQNSQDLSQEPPLTDAVVSTNFLSMLLAQLVKAPFMERIYKELLSAGGIEIGFRPIERYAKIGESVAFVDLVDAALAANEIAIGFQKYTEATGLEINPSKGNRYIFSEDDKLIVLAQQIYD